VLQDDRQSDDLPLGSRGGIAVRYQFPADGEYAIKVRLRRQYQDYVMGMGWPQRLDVRVDGALAKRFTVGGEAKGRPAAASYAGDGEPGFAGDDSWEKYMQIEADAGLEIRMPMTAGAHMVSASFVREMWEPEGLPQPLQRGRVLTNDEIYMGHASVGALSISGPYRVERATRDTASRRALFICQPTTPIGGARLCIEDSDSRRPHGLSPACDQPLIRARSSSSSVVDGETRAASTRVFNSRSSARWWIRISCCACTAIHRWRGEPRPRRAMR
jgi:hypothetical protein